MGDTMVTDRLQRGFRLDPAQADIDPGAFRHGPRKTPAVAMEHRQGPEINRVLAEIGGKDVADRVEVGAAMVGHHAFGIACCPRGIAERDRVPFVFRQPCNEAGITQRYRILIFDFADPLAARESRIVDIDDERFWTLHQRQSFRDDAGEFGINQDDAGAAVIELKGDGGRIEPDV